MIRQALSRVLDGRDLPAAEAALVMEEIMAGETSPMVVSAYLAALRTKGETAEEIIGSARALMAHAVTAEIGEPEAIDICGTGGDGKHTFNISTTAAFVVAGAGLAVAKHGNRAASSASGSADVLEALGATVTLTPGQARQCIREAGIGFLFAPAFHPAMAVVAPVRKELGVRTVFNLIGPLANPAGVKAQLVGVSDKKLLHRFACALDGLGVRRAFVVHGEGGYDEATTIGPNSVAELDRGSISWFVLDPRTHGFPLADPAALRGGTAKENATILRRILGGEGGPHRDTVVLNAALALVAGGAAGDLEEGIAAALDAIDSGRATQRLDSFVNFTRSVAGGAQ